MAKDKFVNPFEVSYEDFLKAIPKETSVKDYLKGSLSEEEIETIEKELKIYNKK